MTTTTVQQHRAAARSAEVRELRSAFKAGLDAGEVQLTGDEILDPPDWLEGILLDQLLRALPGVGEVRTRKLLRAIAARRLTPMPGGEYPGHRQLGQMTHTDRLILIGILADEALL